MPLSDLSTSTQNYLKVIWSLSEWSGEPATTTLIAQRTGNRLSSVSDALKRLDAAGLLVHRPYQPVELTDRGRQYAIEMIRRHRLIETFLVETLGYEWDEVHDEAEELEHAVSALMIQRIDAHLNYPRRDPHGDPIPTAEGTLPATIPRALSGVLHDSGDEKKHLIIERISDRDPGILRLFDRLELAPATELVLDKGSLYRADGTEISLDMQSIEAIFVHEI